MWQFEKWFPQVHTECHYQEVRSWRVGLVFWGKVRHQEVGFESSCQYTFWWLKNSLLLLLHHECLHAVMLPMMMISLTSETIKSAPIKCPPFEELPAIVIVSLYNYRTPRNMGMLIIRYTLKYQKIYIYAYYIICQNHFKMFLDMRK